MPARQNDAVDGVALGEFDELAAGVALEYLDGGLELERVEAVTDGRNEVVDRTVVAVDGHCEVVARVSGARDCRLEGPQAVVGVADAEQEVHTPQDARLGQKSPDPDSDSIFHTGHPRAAMTDGSDDADGETTAETESDTAPEETPSQGDAQSTPVEQTPAESDVPEDVRTYDRFTKIDGSTYDRANDFLRERTYLTAREWAIARLCADFRTETGVEMTKIGEHLPELVPFMTDTYTPQAVNQARAAFEEKVRKSGATFLYGAMSDFFTAEELDDVMYESTEVAKFLLEVEGVDLSVEEELEAEDRISEVMREVREHSAALRHDEVTCPECGHHIDASDE